VAADLAGGPGSFVLAGRDRGKVERLAAEVGGVAGAEVVDVRDRASLERLIRGGDAVINCAGPFSELGEPVVARCVEAGASYVDTTGEQPWMRAMRERYHDAALAAGVPVVNGMAFEWALGDCAAALLAARLRGRTADAGRALRTLDVIYAWGGAASSRGTRRTSIRILGARAWELEGGRWRLRAPASRRRRVRFAGGRERWGIAFGAGEVVTVPRWSAAETVRGWLAVRRRNAVLARVVSPALPVLVPLLRPLLEPLATRAADPTLEERRASVFTIRLEAEAADGSRAAVEVRGADPYGLTAAIAVAGSRRTLEAGPPAGVLAPSQLVDPAVLLESLAPRGVTVDPDP
ncbi:MAG TPA: saccharopine dehydrogenase NADP-binding domain-containing protein, partial [Longimicrobiales bacterium]|nr:saccharopine dehydrogenase NADP-binding domain-containing protein [Longimicrobiales bacterium]